VEGSGTTLKELVADEPEPSWVNGKPELGDVAKPIAPVGSDVGHVQPVTPGSPPPEVALQSDMAVPAVGLLTWELFGKRRIAN